MAFVSIGEAVTRLGVSEVTIRRRLRRGELKGEKQPTPQGFVWLVDVPDEATKEPEPEFSELVVALKETIRRQDETVTQLQGQLQTKDGQLESKDRQIGELHVLLQQAQAALPPPKENRQSWWRFWQR